MKSTQLQSLAARVQETHVANVDACAAYAKAHGTMARRYRVGDGVFRLVLENGALILEQASGPAAMDTAALKRLAQLSAAKDAWNEGKLDSSKLPPSDA